MGQNGFFSYDGSSVREVPCEVHDKVFNNLNRTQISKVWAVSNGQHGEVWFFYCSANSTTVDKYVTYNYAEDVWAFA